MKRALLLNADWQPLHFISDIRAIKLLYKGRVEVVSLDNGESTWPDDAFVTPSRVYQVPATIRLLTRVNKKYRAPRFRKKVLFNRDNWTCQYCHAELNWATVTIDHVIPRSHGGPTTWRNCVASCKSCNRRKADRTPAEAGMTLARQPMDPSPFHFWDSMKSNAWHEHWDLFLPRQ